MTFRLNPCLARIFTAFCLMAILAGCSTTEQARITRAINSDSPEKALGKYILDKGKEYGESPQQVVKDFKSFVELVGQLKSIVESVWGKKDGEIASNKKYVKYTNDYESKAEVDFVKGLITIETIANEQPLVQLKQAIITTLLTTDNPANTDIFSDKNPKLGGTPYLLGQVLDQDDKPIAWQWRAGRFAEHLIQQYLQTRTIGKQRGYYVQIQMVDKHTELRKKQYSDHVLASARKYQIRPDLIYAIIETESSFNPFAVSHANAYGLMQVVPTTAGKDVYQKIHKRAGVPSQQTLFSPKENIDIGTAYLYILQNNYLKKIDNQQSRHFAMISAYNGGAGNVFKTFSQNREAAPKEINKLSSSTVYTKLTKQHPRAESRRYLEKVTKAEKHYR